MRLRTGDGLAIVDICAGGALVESRRQLRPGAAVTVSLVQADRVVTLEARVVRCLVYALEAAAVRYRGALEFAGDGV